MQVLVDHARIHGLALTVIIHILEQRLPGQLLNVFDQAPEPAIVQHHFMLAAALATKAEGRAPVSQKLHMLVS